MVSVPRLSDPRVITVHDRRQAEAAAGAAAGLGVPVALRSAPGAAAYLGPAVFRAIVDAAKKSAPQAAVIAVMDCGEDAGHALSALRHGIERVRIDLPPETAARVAAIAEAYGATVETGGSDVLDLLDNPDPAAASRIWLTEGEKLR